MSGLKLKFFYLATKHSFAIFRLVILIDEPLTYPQILLSTSFYASYKNLLEMKRPHIYFPEEVSSTIQNTVVSRY